MSLPHHRGQLTPSSSALSSSTSSTSMTYRGPTAWASREQKIDEANRSLLEQENDRKWAQLSDEVDTLRALTLDINHEVKSQNQLLDSMGGTFNAANQMFGSTITKLGNMLNASSSQHMLYLIGFIVLVFFLIYFMMGRK